MKEKLIGLREAIASLVQDGNSIVLGAGAEVAIPFAAVHEIIRQARRDLNVIAPISDALSDMLIGAGCVSSVTSAWVGNVSGGLGHNYRRAVEKGLPHPITVRDYSNFSIAMGMLAGAHGMPYVPVKTILGSDILKSNPDFKISDNPFSEEEEPIVLVPPINPDVAILGVQRADKFGNSHFWGSSGLVQESALAAEQVIILADELVEPEVISSDPSRIMIPGFRVTHICHLPGGCHPSPVTGYWKRDNEFFNAYHTQSRAPEGYQKWLNDWVFGVDDHDGYLARLGSERMGNLKIIGEEFSAPTNWASE